ncbi:MAG: DoxX family protein [Bacteroidetes bacterium]|nr:MAG: DoxX family protein [Bacteroidota bacterium]PTM12134.1 MAG: DoxX family protein [Bacteroidota bacterium]
MDNNRFDLSLLLLRLVFGGFMLINHGWGKFLRFFEEGPLRFGDPIGLGKELSLALAVFAEAGCGFLIAIGLFTRLATIPVLFTMLVAAFVVHFADPFGDKESALLFATAYVVILLLGPGRYSVDSWWERRRY